MVKLKQAYLVLKNAAPDSLSASEEYDVYFICDTPEVYMAYYAYPSEFKSLDNDPFCNPFGRFGVINKLNGDVRIVDPRDDDAESIRLWEIYAKYVFNGHKETDYILKKDYLEKL